MLKWADLLRNEEKTMGEKGAWVFQRRLRDQLARDVPLDDLGGGSSPAWARTGKTRRRVFIAPTATR